VKGGSFLRPFLFARGAFGKKDVSMAKSSEGQSKSAAFDPAARAAFLTHLAATANVSESAKVAGFTRNIVYAQRSRSAAFRRLWQRALAEGYAELEAQLLAEALTAASGSTKDSTLKARAQKHRLALALLAAHRASVKGVEQPSAAKPAKTRPHLADERGTLIAQLNLMRTRMEQNKALLAQKKPNE
jgi:hypothetical protein